MANPVEPTPLFRNFRLELHRAGTLLQHFGLEILTTEHHSITLLLRIRHIVGTVTQEHALLCGRKFDSQSLNPSISHFASSGIGLLGGGYLGRPNLGRVP